MTVADTQLFQVIVSLLDDLSLLSDAMHVLLHVLEVCQHLQDVVRVGGEGECALLLGHALQVPNHHLKDRGNASPANSNGSPVTAL